MKFTFPLTKGRTWRGKWYRSDTDAENCAKSLMLNIWHEYEPESEGDNYVPDMKQRNPPGPAPFGGITWFRENKDVHKTSEFDCESKLSRGMNGIGDPIICGGRTLRMKCDRPDVCPIACSRTESIYGMSLWPPDVGGCRAWILIREWPPKSHTGDPTFLMWNHCWPLPPGYQKIPPGILRELDRAAKKKIEREPQTETLFDSAEDPELENMGFAADSATENNQIG